MLSLKCAPESQNVCPHWSIDRTPVSVQEVTVGVPTLCTCTAPFVLHTNDIHYLSLVFSLLFPRGREESVFWRCTVSQCLARTSLTYMSIRNGPGEPEMSRDLYSGWACIGLSQCFRCSGTLLEVLCVYVNSGLQDLPHNPHCQHKRGDRTCLN